MIGALVAIAGPIGFVSLIVPHMLRRLVRNDHLFLAPARLLLRRRRLPLPSATPPHGP